MQSAAAVTMTSSPAGVSAMVNAVSGFATFRNLVFDTPGAYTLTATSAGLTAAASSLFTISAPPSVVIDTPLPGVALMFENIVISGWAIDNTSVIGSAIGSVQVQVDGTVVGNATYGIARPDVCAAYPGRPGCPNVGYVFQLNRTLTIGTHTINVLAANSNSVPVVGASSVTVTVFPFGVFP